MLPISKPVEIAREGTWDAATGKATLTRDLFDEVVRNFSGRVPVLVGHPHWILGAKEKVDGWVVGLIHDNGRLLASLEVTPETFAAVRDKRLVQRSVGLYRRKRGEVSQTYLGHLALLGASPPAVEGMEELQFSAGPCVSEDSDDTGAWEVRVDPSEDQLALETRRMEHEETLQKVKDLEATVARLEREKWELSAGQALSNLALPPKLADTARTLLFSSGPEQADGFLAFLGDVAAVCSAATAPGAILPPAPVDDPGRSHDQIILQKVEAYCAAHPGTDRLTALRAVHKEG